MRYRLFLALAIVFPLGTASAQDAIRNSLAGEVAAESRKLRLENQDYNLRLGEIRSTLGAEFGASSNDNIRFSQRDEEDDVILRSALTVGMFWPLTERNQLDLSLGIGYNAYLENSSLNRFFINPDSELSFDLYVDDFLINFHDRFYYDLNPDLAPSLSGTPEFGGFYNTVGVNVDWDLNRVIASLGYDHFDFISDATRSDLYDRSSELMSARVMGIFSAALNAGIDGTLSLTSYDSNFLNDNQASTIGFVADWQATRFIRIRPRIGFVGYSFDTGGTVGNSSDFDDYFTDLQITHRINPRMSHSVNAGRSFQTGISSDTTELVNVSYAFRANVIRDVGFSVNLLYQNGKDFGAGVNEVYERYGVTLLLAYQFMQNLSSRFQYRHLLKDSDNDRFDYRQNLFSLDLVYRF